jgi:hypothetical protein
MHINTYKVVHTVYFIALEIAFLHIDRILVWKQFLQRIMSLSLSFLDAKISGYFLKKIQIKFV